MNFGDMLVKNGEWKKGVQMYNACRLSPNYGEWTFKDIVEKRIANAEKNVVDFNKQLDNINIHRQNVIMVNSAMSCMGCHQMSKSEFIAYGYKEPTAGYYFRKE